MGTDSHSWYLHTHRGTERGQMDGQTSGVHNAKAEECTTPRIGSITWRALVAIAAVCQLSSLQASRSK